MTRHTGIESIWESFLTEEGPKGKRKSGGRRRSIRLNSLHALLDFYSHQQRDKQFAELFVRWNFLEPTKAEMMLFFLFFFGWVEDMLLFVHKWWWARPRWGSGISMVIWGAGNIYQEQSSGMCFRVATLYIFSGKVKRNKIRNEIQFCYFTIIWPVCTWPYGQWTFSVISSCSPLMYFGISTII